MYIYFDVSRRHFIVFHCGFKNGRGCRLILCLYIMQYEDNLQFVSISVGSFELHAVSITRRFQYMPFPVSSYPPFPLLAVSFTHAFHHYHCYTRIALHTISVTRAFSVPCDACCLSFVTRSTFSGVRTVFSLLLPVLSFVKNLADPVTVHAHD